MEKDKIAKEFKRKFTTKNKGKSIELRKSLTPKETNMDAEDVKSREDFILFLKKLYADFSHWIDSSKSDNPLMFDNSRWANKFTGDFLESMSAWIEDSNYGEGKKTLNWREIAEIFDASRIYE
jgi:hypothetical protein